MWKDRGPNWVPRSKEDHSGPKGLDYAMSLEEIASRLGVSKQYVQAVEKRALAKMKRGLIKAGITEDCLYKRIRGKAEPV